MPLLINPFAYEWWYRPKIESTYALVLIILAAAAILRFSDRFCLVWPPAPLCFFLLLYAMFAIISTYCSIDYRLSLEGDIMRHENLATLLVYSLLPLLFSSFVFTGKQARALMLGLAACSIITSAYALMQYAGLDPIVLSPFYGIPTLPGVKAVGSTLGNANFLGKFLVLTTPLLIAYLFLSDAWLKRLFWALAILLAMAALAATETRASWLGFCIALGIFFFFVKNTHCEKKNTFYAPLTGIIFSGLVFLTAVALMTGRLPELQSTMITRTTEALNMVRGVKTTGTSARFFLWEKGLDQIVQRPWFGYGPDTQVLIMRKYNLEYNSRFDDHVELDKVHNNYLDLTLTQGLFGLFAYCGILASFLAWLWQALKQEKNAELRICLCAVFSAYCGYLVNDIFSFSVVSVSPTFWSLMGLTIALHKTSRKELLDSSACG